MSSAVHAADANITLYVFKKGLPQKWIEVLVDGEVVAVTNDKGVAEFNVQPGIHRLELRDQDLQVVDQQILTHEDEISQWIVNITRGLSALVDVESSNPEGAAVAGTAVVTSVIEGDPGTLRGLIINLDDNQPVEGARIYISGQSIDMRSDAEGRFSVELPPTTYSLSVLHSGFNTLTRDNVAVPEAGEVDVTLELTPSGSELAEFVVIEPYIAGSLASVVEERRSELAVANILGAEQMSKSGDSDTASALRRVTGLTLVDGRFIYIRGLGERYSSTLLNGANVPSPDPTRRVVPLDLFPTSIVESIAVKKGYTSNLPGEFGGGTVELRTKQLPAEPFLEIEVGLAYQDGTTGKDRLRYDGSDTDWRGVDDGLRAQSDELCEATCDGTPLRPLNRFTGEGFTPEELEVIGESLPVIYDAFEKKIPPNYIFNVSGGYRWDTESGHKIGFLAALSYKQEWNSTVQQRTGYVLSNGELTAQNDFTHDINIRSIDLSKFITGGWEFENHKVTVNWMNLRNSLDKTEVSQGFNVDATGGDVRFTELEWRERDMEALQFNGSHVFERAHDMKVAWQYTTATAEAETPDAREYRYDPDLLTPEEDDFVLFSAQRQQPEALGIPHR